MLDFIKELVGDKLKAKSFEYIVIFILITGFGYFYYTKTEELLLIKNEEIAKLIDEKNRIIEQRNAAMLAYIQCSGSMNSENLHELRIMLSQDVTK